VKLHFPTLLLGLAAALLARVSAHAAQSAEQYANLTADGGWCWFSDPRAVSRDGKTYTGWVTEDGSIQAAEIDHASGRVATVTLHAQYQRDDHDNPAFLFLPDGRLMAFYSRHGGEPHPGIQARITAHAGNFTEWEPESTLPLRDETRGGFGISYANPCLLTDETNAVYLFWRGLSWKPTMARSTDGGKTWSDAQVVFSRPGLPAGNRPYAKYASNGRDRIHMLFTDGHPRNEASNSVYYVCYRAGAFYKADGTRICGVTELPIRPEQADCVYDAKKTGVRAWIWSIGFDKADQPVVAYTRLPAGTDHRYHYARWNGKAWADQELCAGGRWFPQTPQGKTESEPHYSGGLSLDPADPSIVYLARPVNGVREIERWTTPDGGQTWKSEAITKGSKSDNVRPVVVLNHAPGGPTVLWQNLSGRYIHFTNYHCSIKTDSPAATSVEAAAATTLSPAIERAAILNAMERVADWQIANPGRHRTTDWTQGALFAGIMALDRISPSSRFREEMARIGGLNEWKLGPRTYHADDHAVGQTYVELWRRYHDDRMLAPMRATFDDILAHPVELPSLEFKQRRAQDLWSWCDSLFMSPPAWVRLGSATGERRYLDFAVTNWWRTSDYLYDTNEHLFFRDSTYFSKCEVNGAKVFWSRGNGWVMGGLVRVLQELPKDDPARARFETQFKEMAAKILACQQPDGLWHSSLLDPASYPLKETSGSGFFTYALAWGVNEGLLDRAKFEPPVRKAWAALVGCVTSAGRLTHVQPIGADPRKFDEDATEVYGVGAFLLAGSEVYRLAT
jgi:rhamnogalacturonyl hydrolase YesR